MTNYFASQDGSGLKNGTTLNDAWPVSSINWTTVIGGHLYLIDTITTKIVLSGLPTEQDITTIRGDYPGRLGIIDAIGKSSCIVGTARQNFELTGLKLRSANKGIQLLESETRPTRNININSIDIENIAEHGIVFDTASGQKQNIPSDGVVIHDIRISNAGRAGLLIAGHHSNVAISAVDVNRFGTSSNYWGIYLTPRADNATDYSQGWVGQSVYSHSITSGETVYHVVMPGHSVFNYALIKNNETPESPGLGEWGQAGDMLYVNINENPGPYCNGGNIIVSQVANASITNCSAKNYLGTMDGVGIGFDNVCEASVVENCNVEKCIKGFSSNKAIGTIMRNNIAKDNTDIGFAWWRANSGDYSDNIAVNNGRAGYYVRHVCNTETGASLNNNIAIDHLNGFDIENSGQLISCNNLSWDKS